MDAKDRKVTSVAEAEFRYREMLRLDAAKHVPDTMGYF